MAYKVKIHRKTEKGRTKAGQRLNIPNPPSSTRTYTSNLHNINII